MIPAAEGGHPSTPVVPKHLRLGRVSAASATALLMGVIMFCFEWLKQACLPRIEIWESHAITIAFASLSAALVAYLVFRRVESAAGEVARDLASERQRLDDILNNVPAIVFEDFPARQQVPRRNFVSSYVQEMFGYTREEWKSSPDFWFSRVHPDDQERIARNTSAILTDAGFQRNLALRWLAKDGRVVWGECHLVAARDAAGRIIGVRGVIFDVTERKLAEASLLESKRFLHSALDALPAQIAILDEQGGIIAVNAAWNHFAQDSDAFLGGYAVGANYLDVCDQAAGDCATEAAVIAQGIRDVTAGRVPAFQMEYPCHSPTEQRWFIVKVTRFQGDGPAKVVVAHENITSRRLAEDSIREKDALIRIAGRVTKTGGWNLEVPSLKMFWSDEVFAILEHPLGETPLVAEGISFCSERFKAEVTAAVNACVTHGIPYDLEVEVLTGQGRPLWVRICGEAERAPDGSVRRIQGAIQDISDRRRDEEELRWKTALLEAQVESYAVGILVVDTNGQGVLQNQRMLDLWKIPPEVAAARDDSAQVRFVLSRLRDPEAFGKKLAWLYSHPDECSADEIELLDGTILDRYSAPVVGRDGLYYGRIWTFTDITGRKRAEAERAEMNQRLVEVSRRAGMAEVASSVLHNVGNVLNSVNVSCSLICEKVRESRIASVLRLADLLKAHEGDLAAFLASGSTGSSLPDFMGKLGAGLAEEQAALLKELRLLVDNIEHIKGIVAMHQAYGRVSAVTETVNVSDLVRDSLRMDSGTLAGHEVKTVCELDPVPAITVDKHKVMQILVNLIRNGKNACEESGRTDRRLTIRVSKGDDSVRIAVIDNGTGISQENLTRIFAHGFTTRRNGHGFGLHSAALAAREMGGSLTVHSDGPDTGATFTLELPLDAPTRPLPEKGPQTLIS